VSGISVLGQRQLGRYQLSVFFGDFETRRGFLLIKYRDIGVVFQPTFSITDVLGHHQGLPSVLQLVPHRTYPTDGRLLQYSKKD